MNFFCRHITKPFTIVMVAVATALVGVVCLLSSCHQAIYIDSGVEHDMAKCRSENISNVTYNICFSIPQGMDFQVRGICMIAFELKHVHDIQLDYSGLPNGSYVNATINGNRYDLRIINEHLILPAKELRRGKNLIEVDFLSKDNVLNPHNDFIYTVFVPASARAAYPCFDQPDIKARYNLSLSTPMEWKAMANASIRSCDIVLNRRMYRFNTTEPISTYLFSFVAGEFDTYKYEKDGMTINVFHREKDPQKLAQLSEICDIARESIRWMEDYTGIPYPFEKYDMAIIPGHPFGGMEHPGAIQYNENKIFLGSDPTPSEIRSRYNLIAHETAHIWFGDLVTMRWFDDVWTKEVFANFMADKIMAEKFPEVDQDLGFVRAHYALSMSTDRTDGTHPLQQDLDNLNSAGLLYGNIIYHKAPIMMRKMEERMGQGQLQKALRLYLQRFAYSNASWDDLIDVMASTAPKSNIRDFDKIWVKSDDIPIIDIFWEDGKLYIQQAPNSEVDFDKFLDLDLSESDSSDPDKVKALRKEKCKGWLKQASKNQKKVWPQQLEIGLVYGETIKVIRVDTQKSETIVELPQEPDLIIPNYNGLGYGRFLMSDVPDYLELKDLKAIQSLVINLYENYLLGRLDQMELFDCLCSHLQYELDPIIQSTMVDCILGIYNRSDLGTQKELDGKLVLIAKHHFANSVKLSMERALSTHAVDPEALEYVYKRWDKADVKGFTNRDYCNSAYHLASMMPQKAQQILDRQRGRLSTEDLIDEFDYISQACSPEKEARMEAFKSMIQPEGRVNEPWARQRLALLCSKSRQEDAIDYITPGLDNLEFIQKSSDIFFPGYWLTLLLQNQQSAQARQKVDNWIAEHPHLRPGLMRKLKEARYYMVGRDQ